MTREWFVGSLAILAVGLSGCEVAEETVATGEEAPVPAGEMDIEAVSEDPSQASPLRPVAEVSMPDGTRLEFFADEGSGAGVLETGPAGLPPIAYAEDLDDASPAEIFWAVSEGGTAIPEVLLENHRAGVAEREISSASMEREQGWLLPMRAAMTPPVDPDYCNDIDTHERYCEEGSSYSAHKCFYNTTGNKTWISNRSDRYKVGVCVQEGTVHVNVSFVRFDPWGACDEALPGRTPVDKPCGAGRRITWTWSAGGNDMWRKWTTRVTKASGDVYDFGLRWRTRPECL